MKKRLLFIALPALLALSACSGLHLGAEAKANDENIAFLEDTGAHEELFDAPQLGVRRAPVLDDVDEGTGFTVTPRIGVQYSEPYGPTDNLYAIRFVAAIETYTDVEITWKRSLLQPDNNEKSGYAFSDSLPAVTTVYLNIENENSTLTPASGEGEHYHYFTVYTIFDIPVASDFSEYYMFAYVTLERAEQTPVKSKVAVTQIKREDAYRGAISPDEGYFIRGNINNVSNKLLLIDDTLTDSNHGRKTGINFKANDKFGLFKLAGDSFTFMPNSAANTYDNFFLENNDELATDYSLVRAPGRYTLYVNGECKLGLYPESVIVDIYLATGTWEDTANSDVERYSINRVRDGSWVSMTAVTNQKLYHCEVDIGDYPIFILCRMNGNGGEGTTTNDWANRWNQTNDIKFLEYAGSVLNNKITITGWNQDNYSFSHYSA